MTNNFFRFGGAAVLAAGMAFAQSGQAATQPAPAKPGVAHRNFQTEHQRMMDALNLTPAQRERAKTIFEHAHQTAQPYRQQLQQNREQLAKAVRADDSARITELSRERGRLEGHVTTIRSEAMAKFYSTLTPAQKVKADQMHQRFSERMQHRRATRTATTG